jgi:Colicin V production protein
MALAMTMVVALVLLLLTLVGAWRDLPRAALALGGTLLGVVLVDLWGAQWGAALAQRLRVSPASALFVAQALLLLGAAMLLGYGGGTLLPAQGDVPSWRRRVVGGLLGLLNGAVLVGFLLQYGAAANSGFAALVGQSALARLLHSGLPLLFALVSGAAGAAVIGRVIGASLRARQAAPPRVSYRREAPRESGASPASVERRINQRRALDKVSDKLNEIEHGR